jgi:hypothetical protein
MREREVGEGGNEGKPIDWDQYRRRLWNLKQFARKRSGTARRIHGNLPKITNLPIRNDPVGSLRASGARDDVLLPGQSSRYWQAYPDSVSEGGDERPKSA